MHSLAHLASRLAALTFVVLAACASPAAAADRFVVGLHDPLDPAFGERDPAGAYVAARAANISVVRVPVIWSSIAPNKPGDPSAHGDPAYAWGNLDGRVREIVDRGMQPLLSILNPPEWARSSKAYGSTRSTPRVDEFAAFATAAARRYDGTTSGVPRVRYWQIWNEPNLSTYLDPSDSVEQYRAMVNAAYPRIRAAAAGNRVVAGGLAPYAAYKGDIAPLRFMRELLCMSAGSKPRPTCKSKMTFDAWSHHPYTNGGPNRSARARDDVSLGDLPEMRTLLRAAERAGHATPGKSDFWVTEFSWDTDGPDPGGVPLAVHARWVAEAFYNMWRNDISLVVWFQLRDNPKGTFTWGQTFQSGLFFRTADSYAQERAKPVRQVVRFPFVALPRRGGGATAWGRTPSHAAGTVVLERRAGKRWVRLGSVRANRNGIFRRSIGATRGALVRARLGQEASVAFKVEATRDRPVKPFGGDGQQGR